MTILQQAITIILCALGTMLTRFLPFLVFNPKKPTPKYIQYLGSALPGAIFGMLVVYCLRNVDVLHFAYGPPAHLFAGRTTLDAFPASQFIGKALVIECSDLNEGKAITLERILQYGKDAENADFLLFHLGWDKRWGTDAYFGDYPCLDDAAMDYIIAGDYKGIGFDVIGLDPIADENLTRHKKLFQNKDIVNIENLKDLDKCGKGLFSFSCFPLKLENCDGSPIRAVAWFED